MSENTLVVKYVKSCIGYSQRHKDTIRRLGFKRLGQEIEVKDTDAVRGMLRSVGHLVQVEER
jgi:large subunit ribosomal protein L30